MSTDCENLLKKFLVLNPEKRASLEAIMRDRWMNTGYEEDELRPYSEPQQDFKDHKRIGPYTFTLDLLNSSEHVNYNVTIETESFLKNLQLNRFSCLFHIYLTGLTVLLLRIIILHNFSSNGYVIIVKYRE